MKSQLLIVLLVFTGWQGFAQSRFTEVAMDSSQSVLALTNPSSVTVNYDVVCYKADGSGVLISNTNQNLAPNQKVEVAVSTADSGKCAGGASPINTWADKNGSNIYVCAGAVTYNDANTLCGTGNNFCMPHSRWASCSSYFDCSNPSVWVKSELPVDITDTCSNWGFSFDRTNDAIILDGCTGSRNVRINTSVPTFEYWQPANIVSKATTHGAACCSQPGNYSSYCRVTVNTTDPAARLISPSFKRGAL